MVNFRTKYNPGDYTDYEHYEEGTSLTEPGQAETMEHLVARLMREPVCEVENGVLSDEEVDSRLEDADYDELLAEGQVGVATALDDIGADLSASRSEAGAEAKERLTKQQATTTNATAEPGTASRQDGSEPASDNAATE